MVMTSFNNTALPQKGFIPQKDKTTEKNTMARTTIHVSIHTEK